MPRKKKVDILEQLSLNELKVLMEAKKKIIELETRRDRLAKELGAVEAQLAKIIRGVGAKKKAKKKVARKKVTKKKVTKKKVAKKKVARKKVAKKKVARKKVVAKKAARKTARRATPRRKGGRVTLEDVVVNLISAGGSKAKLSFQDILGTIQKKKLVKTKSSNFANVLRRTLSTSKRVKRVARGIYAVA